MFRRLISLASFVLLLGLVGDAWAGDVVWKDTAADHLWSTPANWDLGRPPINSDRVILDALPGPTITKEGAVSGLILIGFNQPTGALTVDGGSLQTGTTSILIGRATQGTLNVNGGTINTGALMLGYAQKGNGLLNMNGGTITSSGALTLGVGATTIGQVNLKGGTISASSLVMRAVAGAIASMDVTGGTLILNGNAVATVQGYIDNGWITAYRGSGGALHLDYDVTNKGKTYLFSELTGRRNRPPLCYSILPPHSKSTNLS